MRNPWLCLTIVVSLALISLGGMCGIILLSYVGRPVPESLIAIAATAAGGLGTFLVQPPRGSVGVGATVDDLRHSENSRRLDAIEATLEGRPK